jgi:hypothetical protein
MYLRCDSVASRMIKSKNESVGGHVSGDSLLLSMKVQCVNNKVRRALLSVGGGLVKNTRQPALFGDSA